MNDRPSGNPEELDIVARLREQYYGELVSEAADEIERLRGERDEARRKCCEFVAEERARNLPLGIEQTPQDVADAMGWDCFKEATDDIVDRLRVLNHHAKKLAENESLHDLHREAFTRCEDLTWEAADEIERLRERVRDLQRRIGDASFMIADWDGYYDPETKKGNVEGLANLIEDAYRVLQNKSWRDIDPDSIEKEETTDE